MELRIKFPQNGITESLLECKKLPCIARISSTFEIVFSNNLFFSDDVIGTVHDWDYKEIDHRTVAGAGGKYTHYKAALITLKKINDESYQIIDLMMFDRTIGWGAIIEDKNYAPLHHYRRAISSRENEEDICLFVGDANDKELKKRLFAELESLDFKLLGQEDIEHIRDLYNHTFNKLEFNYYQFPMYLKQENGNLMLEGPKGVVKEIVEKAKNGCR